MSIATTDLAGQIIYKLTHNSNGNVIDIKAVESGPNDLILMTIDIKNSVGAKVEAYFPHNTPGYKIPETDLHQFAIDFDYDLERWVNDGYKLIHNSDNSASSSLVI